MPGDLNIESPCVVMINHHEAAVIGGFDSDNNLFLDTIHIYNLQSGTWRTGPTLNTARHGHSCAKILHPYSNYESVLIVGGYIEQVGPPAATASYEIWNIAANYITEMTDMPKPNVYGELIAITDHRALLIGGTDDTEVATNLIYQFDLEFGWKERGTINVARALHAAFIVPVHEFHCDNPNRRLHVVNRPWHY